ncbi:hypothetical protein SO802_008005 [Lithocarpus litseifolius]|uniref:Uncharacterized protein n=1 Tax=Lithocarpus litseifolius TaxID=425828 RepID=A0AAW2DQM4_9ROSI
MDKWKQTLIPTTTWRASPPAVAAPTLTPTRKPQTPKTPMKKTPSPQLAPPPPTRVEAPARLKTENLNSYATNSDGTKDGGAQGTGPAGHTAPAGSSMPGIVVKEDATKIFTENIQTSGTYSAKEESLKREACMWIDDDQDNESRQEINDKDYVVKVYKIEDISDEEDGMKHKDLSKKEGNYEVWLTVAMVAMLKTIDNDIPVLLEAYTSLKSDGHVYLLIQNHDLILRLL